MDRARFEAWRTGSSEKARASDAAGRVDALLEEYGAQDEQLLAMADEAFAQGTQPHAQRIRRWAVPAALAASVVLVALFVRVASDVGLPKADTVAHFAASDSRRDYTLADGSIVHLDVESEVSARLRSRASRWAATSWRGTANRWSQRSRPRSRCGSWTPAAS